MGPVVCETDRLVFREWSIEDLEPFMALAQDPEVMEFINRGVPMPAARVEDFIRRQISLAATHGWCRWALELRDEPGVPVGFCGPGCTFAPDIEVGWWLRRDLWGRGLATEAARAAFHRCFAVIGMQRVISVIHPRNTRSRRVAEKIGMRLDGEFEYQDLVLHRWELLNPDQSPPLDPRFDRSCE